MTQYINKSALVAEIEKRISNHNKELQRASDEDFVSSWASDEANQKLALTTLIPFLDTLEVKEVDFEKALDNFYKQEDWSPTDAIEYDTHKDIARHFFELGLKTQKGE